MFKKGQGFHFDKRLFEISEFDITRVNCIRKLIPDRALNYSVPGLFMSHLPNTNMSVIIINDGNGTTFACL